MKKTFRIFIFFLATASILVSCLNNDTEERTQKMEADELMHYLGNLVASGYNIDTTASGVYYIKIDEGQGSFPKKGDTLSVTYAGYFIDGTLFGSSLLGTADSTMTFRYLENRMIKGFEDGISIMNKGSRYEFIIPSELAYGAEGEGAIPKYTTLIYVIKMVDIKPVSSSQ
jgi:FKBP-type peptidyl-prolyl cis-trans isomerase